MEDINNISTSSPRRLVLPEPKIFMKDNHSVKIVFLASESKNDAILQIFREFDPTFYEKSLSYDSLVKDSSKWGFYEDIQSIVDLIFEEIESTSFKVDVTNKQLVISLNVKNIIFTV